MRIPFICANWKMYKSVDEAVKYVNEFRAAAKDLDGVEIVLAPSFVALHSSVEAARNSNIGIGAQDLFWEREGPFTASALTLPDRMCGSEPPAVVNQISVRPEKMSA